MPSKPIRSFILAEVSSHPGDIAARIVKEYRISRQAANQQLRRLVDEGVLVADGSTRSRTYAVRPMLTRARSLELSSGLEEHVVWTEMMSELQGMAPRNVIDVAHYGFTEILNNAKDHSEGDLAKIRVVYSPVELSIAIDDTGVGIFQKLMKSFALADEHEALLELIKGKITTAPVAHSGEGIFFTSRLFDRFSILSGSLFFSHTSTEGSWILEDRTTRTRGTQVMMAISATSKTKSADVFLKYASEADDYAFSTTDIPVSLAMRGEEQLVSRSQAKRLLSRLERFKTVILDFKGVDDVGQAFADEIFRVYKLTHPEVDIRPENVCESVNRMIRHAKSNLRDAGHDSSTSA